MTIALSGRLKFSQDDMQAAWDEWGCNCGPSALACILGITLDEVRPLIPEFDARRYTNPSMMKRALGRAHRQFRQVKYWPEHGLIRVQWTGPWTATGANPKWAYRHTHWIAGCDHVEAYYVFDCNGGIRTIDSWNSEIVPLLTSQMDRADGNWFPTHLWEVGER